MTLALAALARRASLLAVDQIFPALMKTWKIPGSAIAITYQGRLVYARGFGYADTVRRYRACIVRAGQGAVR